MSFKDKKNWTNLRELVCFSSNSDNQISKMKISFEKLVLIDEQDVENFYYRFSQIPFENFKEGNEKYKQIYELEDNEIYSYRLIDDDNLEDERLIELLDDLFEYSYALSFEDLLEEEREKNPLHEIFSDAEWDVFELKEKCPLANHKYFAWLLPAYNCLILSNTPINVAGQLLGVFHMLV